VVGAQNAGGYDHEYAHFLEDFRKFNEWSADPINQASRTKKTETPADIEYRLKDWSENCCDH
jgi:hypothetical protein